MLKKNNCRFCKVAEKESGAKRGFREEVAFMWSLKDGRGLKSRDLGAGGPS